MPQTILITGANRGIGLALTKRYLSNDEHVIATCRDPDGAEALKAIEKENRNLSILPLDVTDESSIAALAAALDNKPLDVLINNAGILTGANQPFSAITVEQDPGQTFGTIDAEAWLKVIETNTIAPVMVIQALFGNLKKSNNPRIAMISSGWGSIAGMDRNVPFAYGSSKAALNAATKILSSTLQKDQIVVVTLNPGWVRTDMGSQEADLAPEESARRLVHIIDNLTIQQTGQFLRHTGENIAW